MNERTGLRQPMGRPSSDPQPLRRGVCIASIASLLRANGRATHTRRAAPKPQEAPPARTARILVVACNRDVAEPAHAASASATPSASVSPLHRYLPAASGRPPCSPRRATAYLATVLYLPAYSPSTQHLYPEGAHRSPPWHLLPCQAMASLSRPAIVCTHSLHNTRDIGPLDLISESPLRTYPPLRAR